MDYLLKTEPSTYSFADLQRDKVTVWDGVSNPVALKNLRAMKPGERLVIYHTGDEKSAVGTATVVSVDASDAKNPQVKAFVQGVTAAAVGAIAGAAVILSERALVDGKTIAIAATSFGLLVVVKKIPEPVLILGAGAAGIVLHHGS